MKTVIFESHKDKQLRKGLIAYSVVLLAGLFVALSAVLFAGSSEALVVDRGISCSGAARSGAECNVLGYPQNVNHMFGCYNKGAGFKCYEVPANSNEGLPGCFLDTDGQWKNCGCDIAACENACRNNNANNPGSHTQGWTCNGCGQNFLCGCTVSPTIVPTTGTPTPPPQGCPSTQARFLVGNSGLVKSGQFQLTSVPPFEYSVLINGDVNQKFQGTVLLTTPNTSRTHNNGDTRQVPTPHVAGNYRLVASLNGEVCDTAEVRLINAEITNLQCWETGCNDSDKQCAPGSGLSCVNNRCVNPQYPNNPDCKPDVTLKCWETGCSTQGNVCENGLSCLNNRCVNPQYPENPTCEAVPGITLDKMTPNGPGPYNVGQIVPFRITITNTGQTTYSVISFRDSWNTSRLDFIRIINNANGNDVTSNFTINRTMGVVSSNDITTFLGDLGPGQSYNLRFEFRALAATNRTCNDVSIVPIGGNQMTDDACVSINQPPPTDM